MNNHTTKISSQLPVQPDFAAMIGQVVALAFKEKIEGDIFLFGSVARGDSTQDSDIDLLVSGSVEEQRRISRIATNIEWEMNIPVQVTPLENLSTIPGESVLIYSYPPRKFDKDRLLIKYEYKTVKRSKKTLFTRYLNKCLKEIGGEKLGNNLFMIPYSEWSDEFLQQWSEAIKIVKTIRVAILSDID
ncbi:MAG: nucleotidyltransferase family protein [Candidatus Heimdallarchaeota archaeon]